MLILLESIIYSILILVGSTRPPPAHPLFSSLPRLQPLFLHLHWVFLLKHNCLAVESKPTDKNKGSAKPEPSKAAHVLDSTGKFVRHSGRPRTTISKQEWHRLLFHPLLSFLHNIFISFSVTFVWDAVVIYSTSF